MKITDFRSDTVTHPTPAMRTAMANAVVGDDVYNEDPTINALEAMAAEKLGKEAALFVASGTMGNLIAILTHANRGDEAIVGIDSHTYKWEAGGMATLGGIVPRPLPTDEMGRMDLEMVKTAVRSDDVHYPFSSLILVENSYGDRGGYPVPLDYFTAIRQIADDNGLAVHLDGARLFNAATALGVSAATVAKDVDSVSFCLSKGLCAPAGSMLCGSQAFINKARRIRKSLGGGMRQVGILAAAGLIAIDEMSARLAEDHALAQRLAHGLATMPSIIADPSLVKTNIIFFELADTVALSSDEVAAQVESRSGIKVMSDGGRGFRAVTHYWVGETAVDTLLSTLADVLHDG